MEKVITYSFGEDFIENLSSFLCKNFLRGGNDLGKVACVFGGKRPALFLKRRLAQEVKQGFISPCLFSVEEFVDYIIGEEQLRPKIGDLDAYYLIYTLAKKQIPGLIKERGSFSSFLPWAREIISFIEQLDLEDIDNNSLSSIEKSADIGYEVPESINRLLQDIVGLREAYHRALKERGVCSRGLKYLKASRLVQDKTFEFEVVIFCNFFYLHSTETAIVKAVLNQGKGISIFQGSQDDWPVLKKSARSLGILIKPKAGVKKPANNFSFYRAFDMHSQVCLARDIVDKKIKDKEDTIIIMPRSEILIPLLTEASCFLGEFNVSLGYPLRRGPVYALLELLLKAQTTRKQDKYYTKDYLNLLRHPLIKNLKLGPNSAVTRIMIHKIEELLKGQEKSSIGGSLFLSLSQIEKEEKIYLRTAQALENMNINQSPESSKSLLKELHRLLFETWQNLSCFNDFSHNLDRLLGVLTEKSSLIDFPLNFKVIERLYTLSQEFKNSSFSKEPFSQSQIVEIFKEKSAVQTIAFSGSPLKGLQILGLFEARSLSFKNVIVLDANESILPKLKIYEPLIPQEVMANLGLNRLEKEEEIQRYQLMRLISGANQAHFIYEENQVKEKSRFIEELLWLRQKQEKKLEVASIPKVAFSLKAGSKTRKVEKTKPMVEYLKKSTYSASRINTYLRCPLQFYYRYVLGLEEKDDLLKEPESSHIGIFIHELLEETFKGFLGKKPTIDAGFVRYFVKKMEERFEVQLEPRMRSDSFFLKKIIEKRLRRFLDNEKESRVTKIICLEDTGKSTLRINNEEISFKYTIDRIDELEDKSLRVIDYKTGGSDNSPGKFAVLANMAMNRQAIKENIKSFQLPLYYYFTRENFPAFELNAELYNLRTLEKKAFISEADAAAGDQIMNICLKALEALFSEIFDPKVDFTPDKDKRQCSFCCFKGICK
jgi:hypothetical protein